MKPFSSLLAAIVAGACLGCAQPKLHISSSADAAGAEIFVDGKKAGVMAASGDASSAHLSVANGVRKVEIVKNGRRFKAEIEVKGEAYANLDLEDGRLSGG